METPQIHWSICLNCSGWGTKNALSRKQAKDRFETSFKKYELDKKNGILSKRPKTTRCVCNCCSGSGLIPRKSLSLPQNETFPHIAIIGAGIGGVALAVACLHRNIPFTLYEKDKSFEDRSQGYGLTLQQASNAIKGLGLFSLKEGIYSKRHLVYDTEGNQLSEWGMKTHIKVDKPPKRINVHIPRQSLRLALLNQLGSFPSIHWGYRLVNFKERVDKQLELVFESNGQFNTARADLLVGADGIYSTVFNHLISQEDLPLKYTGYMVILGICPIHSIKDSTSPLLDSETVFQTVNGSERIYVMPFSFDSVMWQFSFPLSEKEAKNLKTLGSSKLKEEACLRAKWHDPIPQMLLASPVSKISGYPVYDKDVLNPELLKNAPAATLIGDAAHPMTPFKGQGANQALLDALLLARTLSDQCTKTPNWKEIGLRKALLNEFENEMLDRSASKVKDSAKAAELLHSTDVLRKSCKHTGRLFSIQGR
jgi:2-polyprenyl-6-methoxyphenol hydroxylase-like FAD-dependent oxidoreductase